jgi:hypothetical protein
LADFTYSSNESWFCSSKNSSKTLFPSSWLKNLVEVSVIFSRLLSSTKAASASVVAESYGSSPIYYVIVSDNSKTIFLAS